MAGMAVSVDGSARDREFYPISQQVSHGRKNCMQFGHVLKQIQVPRKGSGMVRCYSLSANGAKRLRVWQPLCSNAFFLSALYSSAWAVESDEK